MNQKIKGFFVVVCLLIFGSFAWRAAAAEHSQTLTIVKYGLSPNATGFKADQTINTGEEINHLPITDNLGNALTPMAGIHYEIQRIEPNGTQLAAINPASSTYTKVGNKVILVTDQTGLASVTLVNGFYLVSEESNALAGLTHPALPVVVDLPVENESHTGYLAGVYLYPKSSVDPEENLPPTPSSKGGHTKHAKQGMLPQTGEAKQTGLVMLGMALLLSSGLVVQRRRRQRRSQ